MMKADYWGEIQETHHVYDNLPEKEVSGDLAFGGGMQSSVITGAYNAKSYAFIYKLISVDDKF